MSDAVFPGMRMPPPVSPIPLTLREAEFQTTVIQFAQLRRWLVMHTRNVKTPTGYRTPLQGNPGFPDLALARDGRLLCVELKRQSGRLEPSQRHWSDALGEHWRLWRPGDWNDGTIMRELW